MASSALSTTYFRRSCMVRLVIIVIVAFVVFEMKVYTGTLKFGRSERKSGVRFVTSEITAKKFVFPDLHEKRHIVYIRIPKTGSSTATVLLYRYAWTRNLSLLAVRPYYEPTKPGLNSKQFFLSPGKKYDVMAEHVIYNKGNYTPYFHNDTFYFTLLREPMSMLRSTLYFLGAFMRAIPGDNKVKSYLQNPNRYDRVEILANRSYTKNPQSSYLGLPAHHFDSVSKIKERIHSIEKDLSLVMILEKFDESLILFRRLTNWPMKDLIYNVRNINKRNPRLSVSSTERQIYRNWSMADHVFYDYFSHKLEEQIAEGGQSFQNELKLFKKYKSYAAQYCRFENITNEILSIPATPYHDGFTISRKDCSIMSLEQIVLNSAIRKRQNLSPYLHPDLVKDEMKNISNLNAVRFPN